MAALAGFEIVYEPNWPANWAKHDISYTLVPESSRVACTETVNQFLNAYPKEQIHKRLKKITLLGSLVVNGSIYRGTNQFKLEELFIVCREDRVSMLRTLHHEFSSVLIWNNMDLFSFSDWVSQNENGLETYVLGWQGNADEAAKQGLSGDQLDESLFKEGLLTPYSKTSFENDFNRFAEFIFIHPDELYILKDYVGIRNKIQQFIAFYELLGLPIPFT